MESPKRPSLVEQVRHDLLQDLATGKLTPGTKLANETELAERFAVSRATIREAVRGLMDAGYLARRHGSGTFVTASPRTRHPLETTVSYTGMIRAAGHKPREAVMSSGQRTPAQIERDLLGLDTTDLVIEVERIRFADHRPVIYSRDRIPASLLSRDPDHALDRSLYALLASSGHPVASASAQLIPVVASTRLAKLLGVTRGTPLLHIDQVDYDPRGRAIMLSDEWHVADAFELIVNRRASSLADAD
ncbi:MAG: GntR family transcriptional regulator [Solirubrobacteraceae bacterium]